MPQKQPLKPILLVEDDPHHADLITDALRTAGLQNSVVLAQTGQAALEYFFQGAHYGQAKLLRPSECPCLVILDIRLPDMDGLEVLKRLKQDRVFELIPVMVLTTSANERDIKRGYDLQANAYVTKPVEFQEFLDKVRQAAIYWVRINEPIPA